MVSKEFLMVSRVILICLGGIILMGYTVKIGDKSPSTSLGPAVTALVLINADTDQDIAIIEDNDVFNLKEIGTSNLNIRAEVEDGTESVIFDYQGNINYRTENHPVYAIGGDNSNDYNPWIAELGQNTLSVTAYSGDNGSELAGPSLTINFEIIEEEVKEEEVDYPAVVRINSGGPEISFGSSIFIADNYFSGNGKPYIKNSLSEIANTTQDEIYKSERSTNASKQSFTYNIPVTNGEYEINLHFAEIYWGATGGGPGGSGKRIFDVTLEGNSILSNFDINAEVPAMTALIKTFSTSVTDQSIDITFSASLDQPKLSAIEIFGEGSLLSEPDEVIIESLNFINCPTETLYVGDVIDLNLEFFPSNTSNKTVAFTASDAVSIDYLSGVLTALSPGEIVVTATSLSNGDISAQCIITVLDTAVQKGPSVNALILVNADTDQDIAIIEDNDVFNLKEIGTSNLNIRAEVDEWTESVIFDYQGSTNYRTENYPVYAIGGDNSNDYNPWIPELGQNTLSVTAYSGDNGSELAGPSLTINFEIIEEEVKEEEVDYPAVVRINSGGPEISFGSSIFIADNYFSGNGKPYIKNSLSEIANTTQDEIYKSERSTNASKQSFTYNIPVTNGEYEINLHFAEIYWGATGGGPGGSGKRIFDVTLEGNSILSNFDINAEVPAMTALIKTFSTSVTDQSIDITFSASLDQPKLSAIEIFGEGSLLSEPDEVIIESLNFINCPTETLYVGDVIDLDLEFFPSNTSNKTVAFTASDAVGIDHSSGVLTALSPGEIVVTATSLSNGDITDQCIITVLDTATQISPSVNALILVNADTDEDIGEIKEGDIFHLDNIGTANLNIRADVSQNTKSVIFGYQANPTYKLVNSPLYTIGGISGDDYEAWIPDLGNNTIVATAYAGDNGSNMSGEALSINFTILQEDDPIDGNEFTSVVRINSGGPTVIYGDSLYMADEFFEGKGSESAEDFLKDKIHGTVQDDLYISERRVTSNLASFSYNIPVTNGNYLINLHFAEIYFGATNGGQGGTGKRIFDVIIEGEKVLDSYDINSVVSPMTAVIETFSTKVTDRSLDITFNSTRNQAKVSAIEVFGDGELTFDPTACSWNNLSPSSLSKTESQSVKINDKLYVLGGFVENLDVTSVTEIYDPSSNTWSYGAPMPIPVTHMGAVAVGEEIWILGGFAGDHPGKSTDLVQIYNTSTDIWSTGPPLPLPRASGGAAYSEGRIHYFGGLLPDRITDVGDHFVFDLNDQVGGWKTLAPLPEPRNHLGAAAVNGILYAIGGQFGHDAGVDDQAFLHAYDPQTNSWTEKNDLRSDRSHFEPGTIVHNNKIIIVGGRRGSFIFNDITEYDPITDSWSELCQLPARLLAPSAKIIGDQLIVANGGDNGTCCLLDQTISMSVTPEANAEVLRTLSDADRISITPENSESDVSMVDGLENSITLFPNPINDLLTVKSSSQKPINLTLIAPTGTVLIEKKEVLESTFDTSEIKPGLYILIVNNGEAYKRFRIIKK